MSKLRLLNPSRLPVMDPRRIKPLVLADVRNLSSSQWQKTRLRILRRDQGICRCADCRESGRIRPAHEVDHIVPVWEGGSEDDSNLQAINRECHAIKTAREAARRTGR